MRRCGAPRSRASRQEWWHLPPKNGGTFPLASLRSRQRFPSRSHATPPGARSPSCCADPLNSPNVPRLGRKNVPRLGRNVPRLGRLVLRPSAVRSRDDALELRAQPLPLRVHHATRFPIHGREPRTEQRVEPEHFFQRSRRHEEQVFGFFTPEGTRPSRGLGGWHGGSSR
jgi:hypothetical protein